MNVAEGAYDAKADDPTVQRFRDLVRRMIRLEDLLPNTIVRLGPRGLRQDTQDVGHRRQGEGKFTKRMATQSARMPRPYRDGNRMTLKKKLIEAALLLDTLNKASAEESWPGVIKPALESPPARQEQGVLFSSAKRRSNP